RFCQNPVPAKTTSLKENLHLDSPHAFEPLFRSGDWQTIVARFWPAQINLRKHPVDTRLFETEPGVCVAAHCHWQRQAEAKGTLLVVHGLEGSSHSPYVLRMASRALEAGYHVVRLNIRNCGGTEHLGPTLYHSGLTTDLRAVVEQLSSAPLFVVGFSMGGNMALKLAGEWGSEHPPHVKAVCAVSPPIDLAECALRIAERRNRVYEARFLRQLRQTLTRKKALMPMPYTLEPFAAIRTLIDFDNAYTAPAFGYRDAFDYYAHASSNRCLQSIRLPSLVVHAQDDPFIPFRIFDHPAFRENPNLLLLAPRFGGHVAFLSRRRPRFWAEEQALRFCDRMILPNELKEAPL
ncbi:MAG: alpha/beta fold hydrolase, partial [Acidobacteria bacterium]|nr:alpha/beta fold hydrolase [Acidobacteriota bacterium]